LVEALRTPLHDAGYQTWNDALAEAMSISAVAGKSSETRLELRNLQAINVPDVVGVKTARHKIKAK
jgi:hypothetical protein